MAKYEYIKKEVTWPGYLLAGLLSLFYGYLMATQYIMGFGLIALAVTLLILVICVMRPETGVYITLVYAFVICEISRLMFRGLFQAGIPLDIFLGLCLVGVIISGMKREDNAFFFASKPVIWLLVAFAWVFLMGFNPLGRVAAWHPSVRKFAEELVMVFVTFHVLRSEAAIRRFIRVLFVTAVVVGAFGCYEQWFGLPGYDKAWAEADTMRYGLFFINDQFRKFSLMSDPTDFGMVMAACATFFIVFAISLRGWRRVLVFAGVIPILLGMSYSGTRTSNIMIVAGLGLFVLLTLNQRITRVFAITAAFILVVLIRLPIYSNGTLNRFRSSFTGTEDASFNVRVLERKAAQPYILPHPAGGGLGTTNNFGLLMAPGHTLAGVQTDNGYLRIALEQGWIGLIIICVMIYMVMHAGVRGYFRSKSEWRRTLYGAALAGLFGFILGQMAQEVVGQVAVDVVYFPLIGLIIRLNLMDKEDAEARAQQAS